MKSKIEICNLALGFMGAGSIADIDEKRPEAIYCKLYYRPALEKVLREHPWNFAQARERMALLDLPEVWGREYSYAYALPVNCVTMHYLVDESGARDRRFVLAHSLERTMVLANMRNPLAAFTRYVDDPARYDAYFTQVLARQLQCLLVKPLLKGNATVLREAEELYRQELEAARVQDAREGRQHQDDGSIWRAGHDFWTDRVERRRK